MPQLNWLGEAEAKRAARRVPYRMLVPVESVGDPASGNWLIQGDNLDALKALLPFYAGRVKCIFIDPPYNTKSAFEHYDDILLYNGILGDRRPESGKVLTQAVWQAILDTLPKHNGPRIIYGEACRLMQARLKKLNAVFRQIPYDIRMR